jgi:hypothetical protein
MTFKIPPSWAEKVMAGAHWFSNFLKRHKDLFLGHPEPTSLARTESFNGENVKHFYDKFSEVLLRCPLVASKIWDIDETGITAVLKPKEILAGRALKR